MRVVKYFDRMNEANKRQYVSTLDTISRGLSLSKSSFGGTHKELTDKIINTTNDNDERFVFKENCCWFYLDFEGNTLEGIDEKLTATTAKLTDEYDIKCGKVFEILPLDDKKGFYIGKMDFIKK